MHNGMTLTRIQGQGHRDPNALAEVDRQSPYGAIFTVVVFLLSFFRRLISEVTERISTKLGHIHL